MFDLWKLTLPTGDKKPTEIFPIKDYKDDNFFIDEDEYVVMIVPGNSVKTPNTKYSRCELREMSEDGKLAAWTPDDGGEHLMSWTGAIDELPTEKREMVFGQIHDAVDDVIRLKLVEKEFWLMYKDTPLTLLDPDYTLGKLMNISIKCKAGVVGVKCNDVIHEFKTSKKYKGCYFKVGNYQQGKQGVSKVRIKDVKIEHTPGSSNTSTTKKNSKKKKDDDDDEDEEDEDDCVCKPKKKK